MSIPELQGLLARGVGVMTAYEDSYHDVDDSLLLDRPQVLGRLLVWASFTPISEFLLARSSLMLVRQRMRSMMLSLCHCAV
jgi:hypothetical protein